MINKIAFLKFLKDSLLKQDLVLFLTFSQPRERFRVSQMFFLSYQRLNHCDGVYSNY